MAMPDFALLMKPYWANQILNYGKDIELRSKNTTKRGRIALASGRMLLGEVTITDSFLLARHSQDGLEDIPPDSFSGLTHRHQVEDVNIISNYKKVWAWELKDPIQYCPPRPFDHPRGAICWVNLTKIKQQQPKSKTGGNRTKVKSKLIETLT
jgi:hypothetical protein